MFLKSFFNSRKNNPQPVADDAKQLSDQSKNEEWQEILSRWQIVADSRPDDPEAGLQVVNALLQLEDLEEASRRLDELETRHPGNLQVLLKSVQLLQLLGDEDTIRRKWEEYAVAFPDCTESYINLARLALQDEKLERAIDWSDKALKLDPDCIRSLMIRAKIEQKQERWEEALQKWERVNKTRGQHYESDLHIALCLLKMRKYQDALDLAEQALVCHDRISSFLQIKYKALLRLERPDEALAVIEELLLSDLQNNEYLHEKARVCLQLGELDRSEDACRLALEKEPDNVQLLTLYARIGQKRVNYNAAA